MDRGGRLSGGRVVRLPALAAVVLSAVLTGCGGADLSATGGSTSTGQPSSRIEWVTTPDVTTPGGEDDPAALPTTEDAPVVTPAEEAEEAAARDDLRAAQGYVPPAASDLAAGEGWADGPEGSWADRLPVAAGVTMVRGTDPTAVQRALAGDAATREFATAADAQDWVDLDWEDRRWFAVGRRDGVTFAWESFGSAGVDEAVLGPLSRGGSAASFFLNPEDFPWLLMVARDGKVVASADSDTSDLTGRAAARRIARATGSDVLSPGWLDAPGVRFVGVQD